MFLPPHCYRPSKSQVRDEGGVFQGQVSHRRRLVAGLEPFFDLPGVNGVCATAVITHSPIRLFVYTACIVPPFVSRSVRSNNRVLQYSQSDWILRERSGCVLFGYDLFGPDVHPAKHTLKSACACSRRNSSSGSRNACSSGDTHDGLCVFHATFWHELYGGRVV